MFRRNSKSFQIAGEYKNFLCSRELKAGTRTASVRKLMQMYNISLTTANQVQRHLIDEGFLYSKPSCGTFVKHDLRGKLKIGYSDRIYFPAQTSHFILMEQRSFKNMFRDDDFSLQPLSYEELQTPEFYSSVNALLLGNEYLDDKTLPQLKNFPGPVVLVGFSPAVNTRKEFFCSIVLPDYELLLRELAEDIRSFPKLLIFSAGHPNARYQEKIIRKVFCDMPIETVYLSEKHPEANAFSYFSHHKSGYEDTLLLMLSGYFSQALRAAFGTQDLPQILEFDNFEKYQDEATEKTVFTAVDSCLPELRNQGVQLLKSCHQNGSNCRHIIYVKPKLVIRQTFIPKQYIKKEAMSKAL